MIPKAKYEKEVVGEADVQDKLLPMRSGTSITDSLVGLAPASWSGPRVRMRF